MCLSKRLEDISVGDVLRALEGSLEPVDCAGLEPNGGCSVSDSCVTKICLEVKLTTVLTRR